MPANTVIQVRRDTAANWTTAQTNAGATPVLAAGEIGFETDTGKFKLGDGTTLWGALQYFNNAQNPLLSSISTVGGGGSEGGQINFARVTDGAAYWYIDSFGSTSTPNFRVIENTTSRFEILGNSGAFSVNGQTGSAGQVLTSQGSGSAPTWNNPNLVSVNATAKSAAYTLATSDYGTLVQMNGAFAFTVGTGLYNAPVGTQIMLLALTAGVTVTFTGAGVTGYSTPGTKLRAQYSTATLVCLASSASTCTWLLTGDLSA